ncbi:amidase [Rhizobium azooxidifex]|uniref:Amidase n=1 Tax=Mycoplana azooxidifex TaxID=1636188 RepID=A0A7W6GKV7_9HYPH|nr:amidase [Mycoplana azooxidifex]MBB3978722.1 amidase [Mycoplana azooxidifex]
MTAEAIALHYLELTDVAALIRNREISSREVTRLQIDRMASLDGDLHSYALMMADAALVQADAADAETAAGRSRGPLHGVPIAIKDVCQVKGFPTGAGMAVHRHIASDEDATVVRRLKKAGAVLLGKPQLTEGAYSDHHPSVTPPRNPWNADYWPGISSSGSGAAVAAGLCYGSLATDTGGSIRWPAAANGVTGLKPTWGRVSRYGVFELAPSLDHVGTMARSAVDAGILLGAIAGSDPKDPTALLDPVPDYPASITGDLRGLRIGVDAAWNSDEVDAGTQAVLAEAIKAFSELGAEIVDIQFPDVAQVVADWVPNCAVEAAVAHKATYAAHKDQYGTVLASVVEAGHAISGIEYQEIWLRRMAFRGRVEALFEKVDLLLTPVQPFAPLTLARIQTLGEQPGLIAMLQRYTCPFDMSGHPTLTLPGGFTPEGMPIGFQLVAGHLGEAVLVRAGAAFQGISAWHRRHPVA